MVDDAQRKSIDTAMQLIRETGTCAVSEEDFAALYAENDRLRGAIAEHRDDVRQYVHRAPEVAKKANPADERLWAALDPGR